MDLQIFPPLPRFKQLLMYTLWLPQPAYQAYIPAILSPSIMLMVRGGAEIVHANGRRASVPRFFLRGPFTEPMYVEYAPDTITMTVCLIPGMLSKTANLEIANLLNGSVPMDQIFDPICVAAFLKKIDATCEAGVDAESNVRDFHTFLSQVLHEHKKNILGDAIVAAHKKIFFPMMTLSAYFGIGERQLERRIRTTFGVNLRELRRLVRFGFTLQRIANEGSTWGDLTQVAQDSGYYDQAHMHKEFQDLAGISPTNLLQRIAAKDPAYWVYQLSPSEFQNLFIPG
ncbi:helix-turn-helix domain-containing protein [Undibacterium flavidum]|uniref:AraC family transcriptional regulator n=1 Tax=Undibacterium flavidum TaxID=2762297 RepID=A0ABR6YFX0_9BURK|nr:helix-turn-helix domain-containing protein [Undibacterium flavidum]MBC3875442.1 AraC family transcriptional regulator [Undibacterium flavidum]